MADEREPAEALDDDDTELEIEGDDDGEGTDGPQEGDAEDDGAEEEQGDGDQGDRDQGRQPEGEGRQRTRGQNRVERALREAREAREEARLAREEAQRLRNTGPQVSPEEFQRRRAEHLATLDPDQRTDFLLREQGQQFEQRFQQLQFQSHDAQDQSRFETLCTRNKAYARVAEAVERRLAEVRREGRNAPRELIAKVLIGEAAIRTAERTVPKRQRAAEGERQRQTARPGGARSDVGGSRRRTNPDDLSVREIEELNRNARI